MTDLEITDIAVDFVLAMMSSASTDNIRPLDWWTRARSALETSASVAESWPQMVSKFGSKIQVDACRGKTSHALVTLKARLGDGFGTFRALCQRDALYIVAMAQAKRDEQKEVRKGDEKHFGERALAAEETIRLMTVDAGTARNRILELEADNAALKGALR